MLDFRYLSFVTLLLSIKHAGKYLKSLIPDSLYNIFFARHRSNHYRFQLLVDSTTSFHPVWRGLDNIRSNPWSTRDKNCSTWETKITVPCRITATLPPVWACIKLVFISMHFQSGLWNCSDFEDWTKVKALLLWLLLQLTVQVQNPQSNIYSEWFKTSTKRHSNSEDRDKWRPLLLRLSLQLFVQAQDPQTTLILRSPAA